MSDPTQEDYGKTASQQGLCIPEKKTLKVTCCTKLKIFIVALSFAYFSKTLCGAYMKSTITQIERRFDLSSSLVGLVDAGFEMGNLLFLALVSHFGAALHRPRLIGIGCFLMAVGSVLTGLPHFFMGRYKYDTVMQSSANNSNMASCQNPITQNGLSNAYTASADITGTECVKDPGSNMWIYVFLGNALRGIGESPITPLGISYLDDFAKAENSAFYIACLQAITLLGPMFGFLLGSLCASLYVDIGFVSVDTVTITSKDARWVGAWWLGFFVSTAFLLLAGIPFWFLPRTLPKQGEEEGKESPNVDPENTMDSMKLARIAKGFIPALKRLLSSPIYIMLLFEIVLQFNAFSGMFTFKAKYMEQQFGQSASKANFLIGVLNLPVIAVGIFLGGLLMKRYKLSVVAGAQLSFITSFAAFLLLLFQFGTKCDNVRVAGLTATYNGTADISFNESSLVSQCNQNCSCTASEWNPVCSDSGLTYTSPCFAGCTSSTLHGKNTVFHNCSCVFNPSPLEGSRSVSLGQCPRGPECTQSFTSYMAVSVLSFFINSLGTTPGYMVIIRCIKPELKSLALGVQTLMMRTLGGMTAPVYFGALIDTTCLKWGMTGCEGRGACRMYNTDMYRYEYETVATHTNDADNSTLRSLCSPDVQNPFRQPVSGCQKGEEEGSPMWVVLLVGNIIRGIGEATLVPLGISYIDDFARPENSAFYIGCLHTVSVIGPLFGYSLGSLCASLYVDIGSVDPGSVSITNQDSRWVGAWWLGYVVAGGLTLLAALPFWFLPRALPETPQIPEVDQPSNQHQHTPSVREIAKGFGPSLKRLLSNRIYLLYLISNLLMFNAFVILITYSPKYLEQQFGQSTSKTNFLIGVTGMPSVALGIFLSGVIMKKFKLGLLGAARVVFFTSIAGFFFTLPLFALSCQNTDLAGVTTTYQRSTEANKNGLWSSCNAGCGCPDSQWDPVCGQNGITYISPCHAGCTNTYGTGRNMTFHNCTCIRSWGLSAENTSAALGRCPRESKCSQMLYIYLALQSVSFLVYCLGSTPLFVIALRSVEPELKSLSVGMVLLVLRVLGGIPAPIYFGAIIDSTCLKWGNRKCGGRGACRMYDTHIFRFLFLGMISCLRVLGYALFWIAITYIKNNNIETDKKGFEIIELQKPVLDDPEIREALHQRSDQDNQEVQKSLKEFA